MEKNEKLWSPSFIILWQSQLVSTLGDAVYSIALGFWVLAVTGSTALMGLLMAVSTLPGIIVSPFAGVLIDRTNKKRLMIAMDLLRGIAVVLLAAAAYGGYIQVWMVFATGIILSTCGAVFSPGVSSSVPELVPASRITNANSVFSAVYTGSNLLGSAASVFNQRAVFPDIRRVSAFCQNPVKQEPGKAPFLQRHGGGVPIYVAAGRPSVYHFHCLAQ